MNKKNGVIIKIQKRINSYELQIANLTKNISQNYLNYLNKSENVRACARKYSPEKGYLWTSECFGSAFP